MGGIISGLIKRLSASERVCSMESNNNFRTKKIVKNESSDPYFTFVYRFLCFLTEHHAMKS
jgi:hypothetical protein